MIASKRHAVRHSPQQMHTSCSIVYCVPTTLIASTGHTFTQRPQEVHLSWSILKVVSCLHTPAVQWELSMWSKYSSRKYRRVLRSGLAALFPRPHRLLSATYVPNSSRVFKSSLCPWPEVIRLRISTICSSPSRQGVHFPHDSSTRKLV